MNLRITTRKIILVVAAMSLLTTGVVFALVQVTKDVTATVTVNLKLPDGIEVYANENLSQVVNQLNFGEVVVDKFGTMVQPSSVPIWVKNWSASTVRLDLDDDFGTGDVLFAFAGENPMPLSERDVFLEPEGVLPGEVSLRFDAAPAEDEHNFTVFFNAEGPILVTPTPTPVSIPDPDIEPPFEDYWDPPADFYGEIVYGGHLISNYEDPLDHANVWGAPFGTARNLRAPVHNNIVMEDPYHEGEIIPDLARGWTFHEDGLGVTFVFHDGIEWHNGELFTCEDARFSLQVMAKGEGITASGMADKLTSVDVDETSCLSDLELSVRLTQPSGTLMLALTNRDALIFNKGWFEAGGEDAMFTDLSVGTGPFVWREGQQVGVDEQNYDKNPNYFKEGLPYLDELTIFGVLDESQVDPIIRTAVRLK